MSKTPSKPTTKESHAMPRTQFQTPNRFEVLGKIPKPSFPSSSTFVYHTKEAKLLIQILEADHISALGDFDYQKNFKRRNILNQMMFQKLADSMSLFSSIRSLCKYLI